MNKTIQTYRNWDREILNRFEFNYSNGFVEGLSNLTKGSNAMDLGAGISPDSVRKYSSTINIRTSAIQSDKGQRKNSTPTLEKEPQNIVL